MEGFWLYYFKVGIILFPVNMFLIHVFFIGIKDRNDMISRKFNSMPYGELTWSVFVKTMLMWPLYDMIIFTLCILTFIKDRLEKSK